MARAPGRQLPLPFPSPPSQAGMTALRDGVAAPVGERRDSRRPDRARKSRGRREAGRPSRVSTEASKLLGAARASMSPHGSSGAAGRRLPMQAVPQACSAPPPDPRRRGAAARPPWASSAARAAHQGPPAAGRGMDRGQGRRAWEGCPQPGGPPADRVQPWWVRRIGFGVRATTFRAIRPGPTPKSRRRVWPDRCRRSLGAMWPG